MQDKVSIKNIDDVDWKEGGNGKKFKHRRKNLTMDFSSNKMVTSLYEIPPGKSNYPLHYHTANEEIFFILKGKGKLRTSEGEFDIKAGDYLRFPASPHGAHQLINTSDEPLHYLDVGTTEQPDVVVYPDSNKVGVFAGSAPGQNPENSVFKKYFKIETNTDYWKDE